MPVIIGLIVILLILFISNIKIVPQAQAYVIERLGTYKETWDTGIHVTVPIIDRVAKRVTLKETVVDFDPQNVITKDNVSMKIDTVVYMQIVNPELYTYGVDNPTFAIENLTATTLRNIIGDMELDETLTSRDVVNGKITAILDKASDKWGIKVNRVELKNIIPPKEIQQSMEKQMKAERDRRETLLEAEGHKQAIVTREEGNKQAKILAAEAERASAIARAEGQAKAIQLVYEAQANGLKMLRDVAGDEGMLLLKKLEALEKLGDGRATKLIVPTELTSSASNLTVTGELLGLDKSMVPDASPKDLKVSVTKDDCCEETPIMYEPEITMAEEEPKTSANEMIMEVHKRTNLPIHQCAKALANCNYDIEATISYLENMDI